MDLEVVRNDLERVRMVDAPAPELEPGQARLRVDAFGLSSNNITYAVFGDLLGYWQCFPAAPADAGDDTVWGRIPTWGFGDVVETRSSEVTVGERFYGYFPMSTELVIVPGRGDDRGIFDTAEHRAGLASAYNRYARVAADPLYRPGREHHQMLLFPLFFTSFVIDDFLADNGDFGAEQVVISSMSSKTSIGTAFLAHQRGLRVIGLTSPANAAFVEGLGVVDEVVTYDEVDSVPAVSSVYVDVAGNTDVRLAVHRRLGDLLGHSMTVGGTHWDHEAAPVPGEPLPGPEPQFFFAPTQIAKRSQDWGREGLDARTGEAWDRYTAWVDDWIEFHRAVGVDAVRDVYLDLLAGRVDPRIGHLCTLAEATEG